MRKLHVGVAGGQEVAKRRKRSARGATRRCLLCSCPPLPLAACCCPPVQRMRAAEGSHVTSWCLKRIGRSEQHEVRKRRNKMATAVPRVSVQPDRVTFTVQHEVEISYADPPLAAASESEWLSTFAKIIESRECKGWDNPEVPSPEIQALYHSSALPVPIGNAGMQCQSVTNGLVSACLFAFAKVCPSPSTAKNPRDFACIVLTRALQHKRLVLRPDDIFLPLLDAAATHVFQNGEASRNVFVSHQGQKVRASFTRGLCVHYLIADSACLPRRV